MKISTKKTRAIQSARNTYTNRRKTPATQKNSQKLAKDRISLRKILSHARSAGKVTGLALIIAFIYWIGIQAYHSEKFHVRDIAIYGCKELDPQMVEQIVRDNISGNVLDIEMDRLKERLEEVQWIQYVEIRRVLPSGLIIRVHERIPSVILQMKDTMMVADSNGILLDRYDTRYGKLDVPVFRGIVGDDFDSYRLYQQENSARIRNALNMLAEIESGDPLYVKKISEVDISDSNNLKIMLVDDTAEIQLGNEDYFKRLHTFMNSPVYREMKEKKADIAVVYLQFKNNIVYSSERAAAVSSSTKGN